MKDNLAGGGGEKSGEAENEVVSGHEDWTDLSRSKTNSGSFSQTLKARWPIFLLPLIVVVVALAVNKILSGKKDLSFLNKPAVVATPTVKVFPTIAPSPSPSPAVFKKSDFNIKILNGSGIPGAAGKLKKILRENEFVVIGAANADNYNYQQTEIRAKETVPSAFIDDLKETLSTDYSLVLKEPLSATGEADLIITVGEK